MSENQDALKDDEGSVNRNVRVPCKRQCTRSATSLATSQEKEDTKDDVKKRCDKRSDRVLRRLCKQKQLCTRSTTSYAAAAAAAAAAKEDSTSKDECSESAQDSDVTVHPSKTTPPDTDSHSIPLKNTRRAWEQWSNSDLDFFYQGLSEHGKEFAKIHLYMKKKKIRAKEDTKTKEQIRHYYFNTWAKLSRALNLATEGNPKRAYRRELHYMLCFGELRKRGMGNLIGEKVIKHLHELATKGATYIRIRNRTHKVRPPNQGLRKLYRNQNSFEDVVLPKHVNIEFLPNTNSAFNSVQMHAFNPRIRIVNVTLNSKFSEVFNLFDKRFIDMCPEGEELTLYPVLTGEMDSKKFAEVIANAEDALENFERRQNTPVILDDLRVLATDDDSRVLPADDLRPSGKLEQPLDSSGEDLGETFPRVFGQMDKSSQQKATKPFIGYWTRSIADEIHLRTLFLALGKAGPIKFRYEWKKKCEDKEDISFGRDSLNFLRGYCSQEKTNVKEAAMAAAADDKIQRLAPKPNENENVMPVTIMNCSPVQNIYISENKQFDLPLRPRPGRQRGKRNSILTSQMRLPKNRMRNINSQLLNNAVAVNIIPQPIGQDESSPHLVESLKLTDNCAKAPFNTANLYTQALNTSHPLNGTNELTSVCDYQHDEVIEEGFSADFKSLASLLQTAKLNENSMTAQDIKEIKDIILRTPLKKNPINCCDAEPQSPNLEWLNADSLDVTLSSFRNVNEMQALQKGLKNEASSTHTTLNGDNGEQVPLTNFQMLLSHITPVGGLKSQDDLRDNDPKLPVFHSGDTSQGPFGMMQFDLSNQGEYKTKEEFA